MLQRWPPRHRHRRLTHKVGSRPTRSTGPPCAPLVAGGDAAESRYRLTANRGLHSLRFAGRRSAGLHSLSTTHRPLRSRPPCSWARWSVGSFFEPTMLHARIVETRRVEVQIPCAKSPCARRLHRLSRTSWKSDGRAAPGRWRERRHRRPRPATHHAPAIAEYRSAQASGDKGLLVLERVDFTDGRFDLDMTSLSDSEIEHLLDLVGHGGWRSGAGDTRNGADERQYSRRPRQ